MRGLTALGDPLDPGEGETERASTTGEKTVTGLGEEQISEVGGEMSGFTLSTLSLLWDVCMDMLRKQKEDLHGDGTWDTITHVWNL